MSVIDFQHARDLAIARAQFIRQGGTETEWREILSSLEEAASRFFEKNLARSARRQSS